MDKFMKSGYQNKRDPLRERAEQWLGHYAKKAPEVIYSSSAEDKEKDQRRLYKTGGRVCSKKFAMGGVAKIRHGEATESGAPKRYKKEPISRMY